MPRTKEIGGLTHEGFLGLWRAYLDVNAKLDALREAALPIASAIENRAAQEAYNAGFGASEWRGFTLPDEDEFLRLVALESSS